MRIELRDHTQPCEHALGTVGRWKFADVWICNADDCPGGAVRVFEFNGTGRSLRTSERGSGEFAGRRWQRWIEWAPDDEGTT